MGRLILVGLLAFAVALAGTAYAEVQNIKVSGDLDMKALSINNYDLKLKQKNEPKADGRGAANTAITNDDDARFLLSTVHLTVAADLTDNVSATVRLLNQRVWDAQSADETIHLDNAYVVLKEFLYSPLTVIAGRQNLTYGTGFIVGNGLLADPEGIFTALDNGNSDTAVHTGGIGAEHSAFNAYDAIRLILDYAPFTVEGLFAKINETGVDEGDEDLYGFLVNYKHDQWSAEVEPYWFFKNQDGTGTTTANDAFVGTGIRRTYEINRVHAAGLRLGASPIENLRLSGEGAVQWGDLEDNTGNVTGNTQAQQRTRRAFGATVDARYDWVQAPWTPTTGVGWVYFSGEGPAATNATVGSGADTFNAWDPMYRGSFTTYIQDFLSGRDAPAGLYTTFDANDTAATTNRHLIYGDAKVKPLEDVTLWARYTHSRFAQEPQTGRSTHAGDEIDVKALYDYTEDVQLGLFGGWFMPGKYYDEPVSSARGNDLAWTVGAGATVNF